MPALLPELAKLSHAWCCSAPPVSDDTHGTGFGSANLLAGTVMKSWGHGGEGKDWTEKVNEGY